MALMEFPDTATRRQMIQREIQALRAQAYSAHLQTVSLAAQRAQSRGEEDERQRMIAQHMDTARNASAAARALQTLLDELDDEDATDAV